MLIAGLLLLVAAGAVRAQNIRGTVVDAADQPVAGVVVLLLDGSGRVAARSLTNDQGDYRLPVAMNDSYRLRTMRIGYRSATSDAFVAGPQHDEFRVLVVSAVSATLDTIRVVDRSSCRVTADSGAATFRVWEQVRTALTATQLTNSGKYVMATAVTFDRLIDGEGRAVEQVSKVTTGYGTQAWRSLSADSLRRVGYVSVADDGAMQYYAPGIEVLLSDQFVEDHCFKLVGDRNRPELVGLEFQPSAERRSLPEVFGTLWLDRKTSQLQRLDYRYTGIAAKAAEAGAGGSIDFVRARNGAWLISRWSIRMPIVDSNTGRLRVGRLNVGAGDRIVGIQVTGGDLSLVTSPRGSQADTIWTRLPITLSGVVVDSASKSAVSGAQVSLAGTDREASSNDRGRFSISGVLPGRYTVEVRTAALDAIGSVVQRQIEFVDSSIVLDLRVPSAGQIASRLCGSRLSDRTGLVTGRVLTATSTPAPRGTKVFLEWTDSTSQKLLESSTDTAGVYLACGVPRRAAIRIRAAVDTLESKVGETGLGSERFARFDISLTERIEPGASFSGTVVDSARGPIAGVEVTIADLAKTAFTDGAGRFRIGGIPAGEHRVVSRHIGYGMLETNLAFGANRRVERTIHLTKVTTLDSVVVTDRLVARMMADFEENRKLGLGHFFTRDDLEKQKNRMLADILREAPGVTIVSGIGNHAWMGGGRAYRTFSARTGIDAVDAALGAKQGVCYAAVYWDGVRVYQPNTPTGIPKPLFDLSSIRPDQIEAIEYYAGPAQTPAKYSDLNSACGVLVIHSRKTP